MLCDNTAKTAIRMLFFFNLKPALLFILLLIQMKFI